MVAPFHLPKGPPIRVGTTTLLDDPAPRNMDEVFEKAHREGVKVGGAYLVVQLAVMSFGFAAAPEVEAPGAVAQHLGRLAFGTLVTYTGTVAINVLIGSVEVRCRT